MNIKYLIKNRRFLAIQDYTVRKMK